MKAKFGAIVVAGSGKIGGHVASRNKAGAYFRTKVTPTNPQTVSQVAVRNDFTALAQGWRGLTAAQREQWNSAVVDFQKTDVFGDLKTPSGFNLFMRLNGNLKAVGASIISAPLAVSSVFALTTMSVAAAAGAQTVTITYAAAIPANTSVLVFATPGVSPGKSFVKSEYRKIDVMITADATPFSIETEYIAKFGAVPAVGTKIFLGMKVVNDLTGQAGLLLQASTIVLA